MSIRIFTPPARPAFDPDHLGELTAGLIGPDDGGGWEIGPPRGLPADALAVDVRAAAEQTCERCGWVGGAFVCFHRRAAYRAYMICAACGHPTQL
jgi:hypothetical protein